MDNEDFLYKDMIAKVQPKPIVAVWVNDSTRHVWTPLDNTNIYWMRWTIIRLASGFWQTVNFSVCQNLAPGNDDPSLAYDLVQPISTGVSAIEYAYQYRPAGANAFEFTGSYHQNEIVAASFSAELSQIQPKVFCNQFVISQVGYTRHSQTQSQNNAALMCQTTFDAQKVSIYHRHVWLVDSLVSAAYVAMLGSDPIFSQLGWMCGMVEPVSLCADNNVHYGLLPSRLGKLSSNSYWIAYLYLPNTIGVDDWKCPGAKMSIQDTSVNNKIYASRAGHGYSVNVSPGETWESVHNILIRSIQ